MTTRSQPWSTSLFAIFALLMTVKYARISFLTGVLSPSQKSSLYKNLVTFSILLLPLFLGLDYFVTAGVYLVLLIPFFTDKERIGAVIALALALCVPLLDTMLVNIDHARSSRLLQAHLTQYYHGDVDKRIAFLQARPGEHEQANRSTLIRGNLMLVKGDYAEALKAYDDIARSSRFWPEAQVNRGNIHFYYKEYQDALDNYKAALQATPKLVPALFNMSVVLARQGNHEEADRYRGLAQKEDPRVVGNAKAGSVLEAQPDYRERIFDALLGRENPNKASAFVSLDFIIPAAGLFLILIAMLAHLKVRNPRLLGKGCTKCGRVYFQNDSGNDEWCSQCVNLYINNQDLPSEAKNKKYEEVKKYNRRRRMITLVTGTLFPGARRIMGDHAVSGLLTLVIWIFLVVMSLSPITSIPHPFLSFIQGVSPITMLWLLITLIYWLLFGLRPAWQED